jgi:hypothetical protein
MSRIIPLCWPESDFNAGQNQTYMLAIIRPYCRPGQFFMLARIKPYCQPDSKLDADTNETLLFAQNQMSHCFSESDISANQNQTFLPLKIRPLILPRIAQSTLTSHAIDTYSILG